MDDVEGPPPALTRRMRYRVVLTILDQHEGHALVDMYDANTLEISRGPKVPDPFTVHLVQDVRLRMPAAVRLVEDSEDEFGA